MRDMIHRALFAPCRDDRGAMGVLIAVLIAAGVFFGLAAVVVDLGETYAERAQLQNAADAGALAVAKGCALGSPDCSDSLERTGPAGRYADANSHDARSDVALVCGSDPDGILGPCPVIEARTACPADTPEGHYVDVYTSTRTEDGGTTLDPRFGQAANPADYEGVTVGACARAAWGAPGARGQSIPVTISTCEWLHATADGTNYAPPPPYPPNPAPAFSRILRLHDPQQDSATAGDEGSCTNPKAVDGPGQFGWIDDPDRDCTAVIDGDTYGSDPGANVGATCKDVLKAARDSREPIFIPLYSEVNGTGNNGEYTHDGWAAFIVTGFHLPSLKVADWLNPANKCKGEEKCIYGFFIDRQLMPGGGETGGQARGVSVVKLTG